ncbi:MAG: hypothetical protein DCC68_08295 [Planctomycetota bacterium]|nr:MAG: hypothetical protein DCC68_08295 [Planctomycetota bacterium]
MNVQATNGAANDPRADDCAVDLACEALTRFLSVLLSDPGCGEWPLAFESDNQRIAADAADLLRAEYGGDSIALGFGELSIERLDLAVVTAELRQGAVNWRDEYARVFGFVMCRDCPPYETEYLSEGDAFFRSQQMADIGGFYRAFGLEMGGRCRERPDHVSLELEFHALLLMKERHAREAREHAVSNETRAMWSERAAVCRDGRTKFVRDHLSWWAPSFCRALARKAGTGLHAAAAEALAALLPIVRHRVGVSPPGIPGIVPRVEEPIDCGDCVADCVVELKT